MEILKSKKKLERAESKIQIVALEKVDEEKRRKLVKFYVEKNFDKVLCLRKSSKFFSPNINFTLFTIEIERTIQFNW